MIGAPKLPTNNPASECISSSDWWWDTQHPKHAANVKAFWDSYTQVAVNYGKLAQRMGVEMYSLGTETDYLFRTRQYLPYFTNDFKAELQGMVASVRNVYSGLLTYDQNILVLENHQWFGAQQNLFSDLNLDVVGISGYPQLAKEVPTRVYSVSELESLWEPIFQNYLLPLQQRNPDKPIVFTEFGYTDDVGSPYNSRSNEGTPEPPFTTASPTQGMVQQQNIFQSFYNINATYNDLVRGTFIWGGEYFPYNSNVCDTIYFNIYCRPVAQTVATVYESWLQKDTMPIPGSCGTSNNANLTSIPTTNLCGDSSLPSVSGTGPWTWSCTGSNGGANASCSATLAPPPVNGACGTAHGTPVSSKPTTNLCGDSSIPLVTGTGPWNWTCAGSNGGATASCSASLAIPTFTVTPGTATNVTINPATVQTVTQGASKTFTITAASGYGAIVSGCGGTLTGTTFTTGSVNSNCSLSINAIKRTGSSSGSSPTLADAVNAAKAAYNLYTLSAEEKIRFDVAPLDSSGTPMGNGVVNISDVILILRRVIDVVTW